MQALDEFYKSSDEAPSHPRLRDWARRLEQDGTMAEVELYRPGTALGLAQTEMNLQFTENGRKQPLETFAWDDELNAGLIQLGIKAADVEHESDRFALALRGAFRKAVREFGDGYFNAVLVTFIRGSVLAQFEAIKDVLEYLPNTPPEETKSSKLCRELIAAEISARARELTAKLRYDRSDADKILVGAISRYLDERFTVSIRRGLGLL